MTVQHSDLTFDERDDFSRRPIADKVIRLLTSNVKVSPLVIDGGWGTGKSEFCQKLINLVNAKDVPPFCAVYVDAFCADHADQPLMTLFSAILNIMPEFDRPSLIKKALPVVRFGVKTALKAGVSWVLKQDADNIVKDFEKDLKSAGDELINQSVQALLEDHVKAEESLQALKVALEELAVKKPIVLFIDELDRCRPDFAVSMLESIKHVFDVKGVKFVLVTNTTQLKAAINHCYGRSVDAQRYLEKFLGFCFKLSPLINRHDREIALASQQYFNALVDERPLLKKVPRCFVNYKEGVVDLFISENELSLRDVETLVTHLEIYQTIAEDDGFSTGQQFVVDYLKLLGVFLFCFRPNIAYEMVKGKVDGHAIVKIIGKPLFYNLAPNSSDVTISDILSAIIAFESSEPFFEIDAESKNAWIDKVKNILNSGYFYGREASNGKIVVDVIKCLMLSS